MRCHLFPSPCEAGVQHAAYTWPRAIYGALVSGSPHFYLWRHPVCIRIDSVIYFAADTCSSLSLTPLTRVCRGGRGKGEFRKPRFDPSLPSSLFSPLHTLSLSPSLRHCVRRNDYFVISRLRLRRLSPFVCPLAFSFLSVCVTRRLE